ncbi:ABC transporter permease [Mycolicibacterium sarraceniae]|uniref:Transport permease protein n=1 Tax=Mycolicibacterium sarraceniae TaxID=1534348 RepID=A0A7I7SUR9_9MYCO|nr:ABC transporter permease [Mycolicibacterium sarraceniae]BBY59795.1 transport permease protein [Mycolicibacterium sarraceniae]
MTADVPLRSSLVVESLVFARQLLTQWRRSPTVPMQALLFPTFLLITYYLLVGKSILQITGTDSLAGLVPTCAIAGAFSGALAAGLSLPTQRKSGLLSRLWVQPVHRASALIGRLLAEAVRTLLGTIVITGVGIGLGLRFKGSWLAVIPFMLVPVLVVLVFSMAVTAIAVRSEQGATLIWLGLPAISAVFASSGSPPVESLPSWTWPLLELQPMAPTVESMRALAQGRPALEPFLMTVGWGLVLAAIIGPLAVRRYRAAAEYGR